MFPEAGNQVGKDHSSPKGRYVLGKYSSASFDRESPLNGFSVSLHFMRSARSKLDTTKENFAP